MSDMEKVREAIREGTRFYDLGSGGACILLPGESKEGFVCGWDELMTELLRLAKIGLAVESYSDSLSSSMKAKAVEDAEQKGDGK